jgi:hypothetical protein
VGVALDRGTVFKINTNGLNYAVLHHFSDYYPSDAFPDGAIPSGGLLVSGQTLFGATAYGGGNASGTLFQVNTDGSGYVVLKRFSATDGSINADGAMPRDDLVIKDRTLYGTTRQGGGAGWGVLFGFDLPPNIVRNDGNFGVRTNRFGFTVVGVSNQMVIVDAKTNLTKTNWSTVFSTTLTNPSLYFSDPAWRDYTNRFYRARSL